MGGTHATPLSSIKEIIKKAEIMPGHTCVEVGTGTNGLATVLSLASNKKVVAIDFGEKTFYTNIIFNTLLLLVELTNFILFFQSSQKTKL